MIGWLLGRWRARKARIAFARAIKRGGLQGKIGCEACPSDQVNEATVVVFSELEQRDVHFCAWCWRRFKRRNESYAIPRTRRRKKGARS